MEEAGKHCTLPLLRTSPPCPADGEERPLLPHIVRVIPLPKCTETARFLPAIMVEEKTRFFVTVSFSHARPRALCIEKNSAMGYIYRVIRSQSMVG
jgi:hypothetical protein